MNKKYFDRYCIDIHNYERIPTRVVNIGDIKIGALNPIRLQSMTNVPAKDVKKTILQTKAIFDAGADFVRISTPRILEVENLKEIKKLLHAGGYKNPLIADVHFNPKIAEEAARVVEKVRINPGNYVDKRANFKKIEFTDSEYKLELEKIHERILPLIKICKQYGTAIRIGSNHGSLSDRIMSRYGNTVEGMVEAAMEFIDIFVAENFYNLVVSMKASDVKIMTQATRLLNAKMLDKSLLFPQHLGVTEAGADIDGRLKSAIGIAALLSDGIGDTFRVSLTENPENEIHFSKIILEEFKNKKFKHQVPSQTHNTYNPYISENKYKALNFISNKFSLISEIDSDNTDIVYSENPRNLLTTKAILTNYRAWKSLKKNKSIFPYIEFSKNKLPKLDDRYFYFIGLGFYDLIKDELKSVLEKNNICLVLNYCSENPLGETRYFYKAIKKINPDIPLIIKYSAQSLNYDELAVELGLFPGIALLDNLASGLWLDIPSKEINTIEIQTDLLQAIGLRYSKAEFISCPGCGRTNYDLENLMREAKKEFSHLKGLKIAVMGCIVNGPGEMADADYGFVGAGEGKVHIFKGKNAIIKNLAQENAVEELKNLIEKQKL
ncbi:MAG: (E)-4-hydroxy-3-methylbut-2-enyl-diphosphate synthase [Bacteroidales bacterium]|jgi:(E)-4-hydroxy-3-methylbut-2-enyl-diphosphate synthase|nr:(E)-4-hydroxy-3-methylbut-2-enyl-diphosphate synthase [Bacteroidales bacterium]MCK9498502.1 (E)-4-hydroxy-3-methylbut-2-enyl-diphosphate synthase [Bacteroidales bacterium]MDY0314003.1 (E)-4-hydroxy-3-methylbut-2-enyl-diphosphate synthase [Bacteroidales bacterium]NLB86702.1 (E)-4-hydroxy-3-methylbut-2-enyl-diphosphate synthase [Bacteroidales bacterium]